jgi:hypothetical protein
MLIGPRKPPYSTWPPAYDVAACIRWRRARDAERAALPHPRGRPAFTREAREAARELARALWIAFDDALPWADSSEGEIVALPEWERRVGLTTDTVLRIPVWKAWTVALAWRRDAEALRLPAARHRVRRRARRRRRRRARARGRSVTDLDVLETRVSTATAACYLGCTRRHVEHLIGAGAPAAWDIRAPGARRARWSVTLASIRLVLAKRHRAAWLEARNRRSAADSSEGAAIIVGMEALFEPLDTVTGDGLRLELYEGGNGDRLSHHARRRPSDSRADGRRAARAHGRQAPDRRCGRIRGGAPSRKLRSCSQ